MITAITTLIQHIKQSTLPTNTINLVRIAIISVVFMLPEQSLGNGFAAFNHTQMAPISGYTYSSNLPGFGGWLNKRKKGRSAQRTKNQQYSKYLEIGGGYSFFQNSQQPKMDPLNNGIALFVGYGNVRSPFSLQLGVSTKTAFAQEIFVLKPTVVFGGIKYDTNKLLPGLPEWISPYVVAGLTFTSAVLTDRVYPGIVNYEFKEETDQNLGGYAGAGISFQYKNLYFGPQITLYASGIGQYLAGTFVKQDINVGHVSASFRVAYRLNLRSNKVVCPSYF